MEFLSPIFIPKPLAPINDQNLKKGRPLFLFKLVFEIRFSDALLATEVILLKSASILSDAGTTAFSSLNLTSEHNVAM